MSDFSRAGLAAALVFVASCSGGTKYIGANAGTECAAVGPPPAELGLDPFYARYLSASGVPIVGSERVSETALERACETTVSMLKKSADLRARVAESEFRFAVIGIDEVMTELPEYQSLGTDYPDVDWDYTVRSVGASRDLPVSSVGEENLLCLADDIYAGESIAIFSLAHGIRSHGIVDIDPDWDDRLRTAYDAALGAGLWIQTYAATEVGQYWAEGVQDWYDANKQAEAATPDGVHNQVNTRPELKTYDPELASLISEYLPDDDWRPACLGSE